MKPISSIKQKYILRSYEQGKITLWKAAELMGFSLWEMLEKVRKKKIPIKYDLEDAKGDLKLVFNKKVEKI